MEFQVIIINSTSNCSMLINVGRLLVSEDLDGIPIRGSSSPVVRRERKRETKSSSSKWEMQSAPVVASSKWDNIEPETEPNEPSRKKSKSRHDEDIFADLDSSKRKGATISDEDLDGAPLDDSSPDATRHSSGSRYYHNLFIEWDKYIISLKKERGSAWQITGTGAESHSLPGRIRGRTAQDFGRFAFGASPTIPRTPFTKGTYVWIGPHN